MDSVLPLINRGVINYWIDSKPTETSMLVADPNGSVNHQTILAS